MLTATSFRFRRLLPALLAVAAFFCTVSTVQAQDWKIIFTNPSRSEFHSIFFFDEHSGLIGSFADDGIWRTNDGGVTWQNSPFTPSPTPKQGARVVITDIRMDSRQHGWAALEAQVGCGLYETSDGGATWHPTSYIGEAVAIWNTSKAITITNRGDGGGGIGINGGGGGVSTDGGKTFAHLPVLDSTVGMAFCDDQHGIISGFWDTTWCRTTDGGVTWQKMYGGYKKEAWGIYGVPNSSIFYVAAENGWDWDNGIRLFSTAKRSTDFGATWSNSNLAIEATGHIAGVGEVVYVQHAWRDGVDPTGALKMGFFRSTNQGKRWDPVGGPSTDEDTRFAVMGCRGEVVIAFDRIGNVYKTIDGGDGAFAQSSLSTFSTLKVDSIDLCSPRDTVIPIQNLGCDTIYITNATAPPMPPLSVLDPNGSAPQFPYRILPGETGKVRVRLSSLFAGIYTTRLIIELEREGVYSYDTVQITSATRFTNPVKASAKSLTFDSTTLCAVSDDSIVLSNDSCFTVQIVSSQVKTGTNFSLLTPIANDSLPSGTKKTFTVRFRPTSVSTSNDSLIINLLVLGRPVRLAYALKGSGAPDDPKFVMLLAYTRTKSDSIDFGTRTTCDNDSLIPFLITNPACSAINVSLQIFDSTKKTTPPNDVFKWLAGGTFRVFHGTHTNKSEVDTITGGILAHAARRGNFRGYLRVVHWLDGQKPDTTDVPFTVRFVNGTKTLSMDASTRDLDTVPFCQERDITIPIENLGCDTLFFDSLSISGPGFSLTNKPSVPFTLLDASHAPADRRQLNIHFAPTQAGTSSGTLTIRSDADSAGLRTINFHAYVLPTDTVRIGALAGRLNVHVGDTSVISIIPNKTFHAKNISTIDLTLEYNGDVMEIIGNPVPGPKNITATADPESHTTGTTVQRNIYLAGANIPLDSGVALVSQPFHFYLSDTTRTDFKLAKCIFNKGDAVFAKCTLGEVADSGTINVNFYCGDSLMYRLMHDGNDFRIENGIAPSMRKIRPNPVSNGLVSLPFRALRVADIELYLTSETGQQIATQSLSINQAGESSFDVNISALPSGVYHYVLRTTDGGAGVVSGEFVVMK